MNTGSDSSSQNTPITGNIRLLLGVDGGGSKTLALIASLDENGQMKVLGRGRGGPSNLLLSGKEQSLASLDQAIDKALKDAKVEGQQLDYAVLALAGSTSPDVQKDVSDWARQRALSPHIDNLIRPRVYGTGKKWSRS